MAKAGSGISADADPITAARAAAEVALASTAVDRADAALLFMNADHGSSATEVVDVATQVLGVAPVGATAAGVLVAGQALESGPGVAILALAGIESETFLLDRVAGNESGAGELLRHAIDAPLRAEDLVVLLPDPYAIAAQPFLEAIQTELGGACLVGAGAVEGAATPPVQWADSEIATGAVAGVVLRGARPRVGVTQACQPVTEPMQVTRTEGHWILEIEGRPALDVFRETAREPLASDLRRAAAFVLVALPEPGDPQASLCAGDYRVRNVAGFSENALAVPEPVTTGERIAFVLREPHGARDDLKRMLAGFSGQPADFAVFLDCCARGAALFDVPGLEAAYLEDALGATPLVGMMGAYEFGPVRGRTELLTYTGVLAAAGAAPDATDGSAGS
ncbi:MAG: FIST C-terminal domain-containing protein [Deltaproteobacteria bacterium]|nr:FIST C-terminal domain-containing protein [Deltaproteobacteria bacterium]MBW2447843.1 FIST C-terminal domain-containing protein [Deltaproteobacteria bacterium]